VTLETGAPPPPTNLKATAGNAVVNLTWTASAAGDVASYTVERKTGATGAWSTLATDLVAPLGYRDTAVVNGTTYYYRVRAVDIHDGLTLTREDGSTYVHDGVGSPSAERSATPVPQLDTTPPPAPAITGAAAGKTVTLGWYEVTDTGTPASGTLGYYVYRDGGTTAVGVVASSWPWAPNPVPHLTWSETTGWNSSHTYTVKAYDVAGNVSAASNSVTVTIGPAPTSDLIVRPNASVNVYVTNLDTNAPVSPYPAYIKKNMKYTWAGLPYANYRVTATYNGTTLTQDVLLNATTTIQLNW
jgi:hypothetical protein